MQPEEVDAARDAALAAIAAAADLEALKQVRIDHTGDRSPLALANREIGALPPQGRKEAGQRIGQARGAVGQALAARQEVLEAEAEERMLVEETVDVTLPTDRTPAGARHPITTGSELIADIFVAMGWEVAEGPGHRGRVAELRRAQPRSRPPRAHHAGHVLDRPRGPGPGAAHAHLAGPGADDADPHPADLRRLPGPGVPHRRVRRDAQPGLPPGRGPRDRRGHHHGPPQGHPRPLRDRDVRRGHHDPVPAVVLPVHRAVGRGRPGLLRLPRRRRPRRRRRAAPAAARAGSSGAAAGS